MADSKLSELTRKISTFIPTFRFYGSDGADSYVEAQDLFALTGDITTDETRVTALGFGVVTQAKVADKAISLAKMVDIDTDHIMMRGTSATGSPEHLKISEVDALGAAAQSDYVLGQNVAGNLGYFLISDVVGATTTTTNLQSGTSYTLDILDKNRDNYFDNAADITVTVPASVFAAGDEIDCIQAGLGQVIFLAGSGFTLNTPQTLKISNQDAGATIKIKTATEGGLFGDLELS